MRISDWSSDVCSSDLAPGAERGDVVGGAGALVFRRQREARAVDRRCDVAAVERQHRHAGLDAAEHRVHAVAAQRPEHLVGAVGHGLVVGGNRAAAAVGGVVERSEEHTSELQSLMRNSYAGFCLKKKKNQKTSKTYTYFTEVNKQKSIIKPS